MREIVQGDPAIDRMPARADIKQSRFAQGAQCLGAYRDAKLIGYVWFCRSRYAEDEVRCTYVISPTEHAVFDFDFYILPEYRMGRAFAGIWQAVNEYFRARNVKFTFSRLTRFNLASRRAHSHLGARRVAMALVLQAWQFEITMATIRPFLHASLQTADRVELRLTPGSLEEATGFRSDASL